MTTPLWTFTELAEATGGTGFFCRSSAEIPESIHKAIELISSHYCVTLAVPDRANKNVQIQLEASGNRNLSYRTRFTLRAQKGR